HSDQGFQYCSREYVKILKDSGIAISMSGKANPYDNAKMESFFRTLKVEEVYMSEYRTFVYISSENSPIFHSKTPPLSVKKLFNTNHNFPLSNLKFK
ncbi:unnamed protein product, partial [marine sediment metagenome]